MKLGLPLLLVLASNAFAQESIDYVLRFPEAASHYVEVEASYPTEGRDGIEVMMTVWTSGSYLVREFARHGRARRSVEIRSRSRRPARIGGTLTLGQRSASGFDIESTLAR